VDEIGEGEGEGFTANFPLPPGTGDTGFNTVMDELILPLLDDYEPEMVLVSVGFDAHWRDPLGSLQLSAGGYYQLIEKLTLWCDQNCQGKIALILEGGYDLQAGEACALSWWDALAGVPFTDSLGPSPQPERSQWNIGVRAAHQVWDRRRHS
jgi:acetoin utilization deacetylase AcuC-like enzyme